MPLIYATCLRQETQGPETTKEPMGMRQRVSHHAARASLGDSRVSLNKAIGGDLARRNVLWRKVAPVYDRGVLWPWDLASWNSRL